MRKKRLIMAHLRVCQECGGTHCCDDSPAATQPSTRAPQASGDRIGGAFERWLYCYPDEALAEY